MTPEEKKTLLREKLGITGEPLGPDDFDGPYLMPRNRRGTGTEEPIFTFQQQQPIACFSFYDSSGQPILILRSNPRRIEVPDGVDVNEAAQAFLKALETLGWPRQDPNAEIPDPVSVIDK